MRTVLSILGGLAGYQSRSWPGSLVNHFRGQLGAGLLVSGLLLLSRRHWKMGVAALGVGAVHGYHLRSLKIFSQHEVRENEEKGAGLRVGSFNVCERSTNYQEVLAWVEDSSMDLYILSETSVQWGEALARIGAGWRIVTTCQGTSGRGMTVLARIPVLAVQNLSFTGERGSVAVQVQGTEAGGPIWVLGVHPPSPRTQALAAERNTQLLAGGQWLADQACNGLMIGDMNTTPNSPELNAVCRVGQLRGSWEGRGWAPTWRKTEKLGILAIPIDHGLLGTGLELQQRQIGPYLGSDHRPLELYVQQR